MSDTDSELEFESADEGAQNINVDDLDLSDLSSDEDTSKKKENKITLNEFMKKSIGKENEPPELNKEKKKEKESQNLNDRISEEKISENMKKEETMVQEPKNNDNKKADKLLKDSVVEGSHKEEKVKNHQSGNEELIKSLNNTVKSKLSQAISVSTKNDDESNMKTEVKESVNTGWDETEFSDLDDDTTKDETSRELKKSSTSDSSSSKKIEINKNDASNELMIQSNASKQSILKESIESTEPSLSPQPNQSKQQAKSSGWGSWSKFGNVLSSATASVATLTNAVLETVEATIGAPDPTELAQIVKAKQAESEADSKMQHDSSTIEEKKQQSTSANDWNNDDDNPEWFTFNPLNKLASTVIELKKFDILWLQFKKFFLLYLN
jgi:hypothetical protein